MTLREKSEMSSAKHETGFKIPEKMYRKFPEESRQLRDSIVQFIDPKIDEVIVDVGTGAGFLALGLAEKVGKDGKVIGLDISKSAIRRARLKAAQEKLVRILEFRTGDVYDLQMQDNFADAVCCKSLIASLDNRQKAVSEMTRITKHGGRVVVVEPGELVGLPSEIKEAYYKAMQLCAPLGKTETRDLFQKAKLKNIEIVVREPPLVKNISLFEWTTKNLFGQTSLWQLAIKGGIPEDQVRIFHKEMAKQIETKGLKFGTEAIFCKGKAP
jgi:ubiquinone/menaquinone biosynthesis C-methylase UbiE